MGKDPIYNCAVYMSDQHDCDMAKKLCKKYSVPIWERSDAFDHAGDESWLFSYIENDEHFFYVDSLNKDEIQDRKLNTVSLQRFEEIAIEFNTPAYESVEEILEKLKEINHIINKPNL